MRLQKDDLENGHYRLVLRLAHSDLLPFVQQYYLERRNWLIWANYLLNALYLFATIAVGVAQRAPVRTWVLALGWASIAFVLLIPIHEGIHGLVYLLLGARDVRFGGSLRSLAFYALAHDFVVGAKEFIGLALAPFLLINGTLLALALFFPTLRLWAVALGFLHLTAVSGDWALLGFLWENRASPLYTYDDAEHRVSYFYAQNK